MQIACPKCATSYEVDPSSLAPAGRSVRCVRCRHVWFATSPNALAEIAAAHRNDLAALGTGTTDQESPEAQPTPPAPEPDPMLRATEPAASPELPAEETQAPPLVPEQPDAAVAPHEALPAAEAPALAPADPLQAAATAASAAEPVAAGEDIETVAARRTRRGSKRRRRWPLPGLATTILALIAANTALVAWRADVVRALPQTAAFYAAIHLPVNLRGLVFSGIETARETADSVPVLVVSGTIVSTAKRPVDVPRLRFAVRNEAGQEIYAWTALVDRKVLAPGESLQFHSRLASPPRDGRDVLVRFFTRRDLVAGIP
jgi:predicted Zn finger-like uncharacterized protein